MSIPNPYPNIADKEINDVKTWSSAKIIDELQPALDTEITCEKTYEGNIVTFNNLTNKEITSLECEILPIQEGTGTPSPSNPRPISGTSVLTLKHDNDNMLVMPTFDFTIQGVRVYTNDDGNIVLNGTSTGGISSDNALWSSNLRFSLPKGHYYLSCNSFSTYGAVVVVKNTDTNATICQFNSNWQIDLTETTPMRIGIYIPENKTFDNFVCNFEASLDNITYDVPNRETYTIDLGQEIMGGTADVVGGTGEETHELITLDGSEAWNVHGSIASWFYLDEAFPDAFIDGEKNDFAVCNCGVQAKYQNVSGLTNGEFALGLTGNRIRLVFKNTDCATIEDFKTWLSSNNMQVAYTLATPESFTFTGQPINSYLGVNNVWTDSGNIKVTTTETKTIGNILKERGILP